MEILLYSCKRWFDSINVDKLTSWQQWGWHQCWQHQGWLKLTRSNWQHKTCCWFDHIKLENNWFDSIKVVVGIQLLWQLQCWQHHSCSGHSIGLTASKTRLAIIRLPFTQLGSQPNPGRYTPRFLGSFAGVLWCYPKFLIVLWCYRRFLIVLSCDVILNVSFWKSTNLHFLQLSCDVYCYLPTLPPCSL